MSIRSLRLHGVVGNRQEAEAWVGLGEGIVEKQLWGYVTHSATVRACISAVTTHEVGHEALYVVAPETMVSTPSLKLAAEHYADVPIRGEFGANRSFFDCSKAEAILGWSHDG